jgi:Rrf2 family protein
MRNTSFTEVTMLSATADHALRAILVLARSERRAMMRAEEIAAATGAPQNYMAKTLNALAKAGIVRSTRGPAGGFALAVAPARLTLASIIDLFDAPRARSRCMLGNGPCNPRNPCAAHHRWTAIVEARRVPLTATTIADLLAGIPLPAAVAAA